MKAINVYINEKLVINKNSVNKYTKSHDKFDDNKICYLRIYNGDKYRDEIELLIREPFFLTELTDKKITYKSAKTNTFSIEEDIYKNEFGYIQHNEHDYAKVIYMNVDDMKDFLSSLLKEKVFSPKTDKNTIYDILKNNYIEDIEDFALTGKKYMTCKYIENGMVHTIMRPKDLKEFIAKYYA